MDKGDDLLSPRGDLPKGLLIALSNDIDSMKHFFDLPEKDQTVIVEIARSIRSNSEMETFVRYI